MVNEPSVFEPLRLYCTTRDKNNFDLILTSLPDQFLDIHSPDKLSANDIVSGFLKIFIPHIKKPRMNVYSYKKGDIETMRKVALRFAKIVITISIHINNDKRRVARLRNI